MDIKIINRRIAGIATRGKALDKDIHEVGVAALAHAAEHGDHTAVTRLYHALPASGRKLAYKAWVEAHSPLNWNKEKEAFTLARKTVRTYMIEEANAVPFWEFTVE